MMRYLILLQICYISFVAARPEAAVHGGQRGGFVGSNSLAGSGAQLASQVAPALILLTQGNLGQAQSSHSFGSSQASFAPSQPAFAPSAQQSFAPSAQQSFAPAQQSFTPIQSGIPIHTPSVQYGAPPAPSTIVQKHIYVHVPPAETEEDFQPAIPPPTPQKHYKIIFIKAPTSSGGQQFSPALPPPIEEKTLVYVLVKKPEIHQQYDAPISQPAPSKPEVYFIKYRAKSAPVSSHQFSAPSLQYGPPSGSGSSGGGCSSGCLDANSAPGVDLGTIGAAASAAEGLLAGQDPRHSGLPHGPYHKKK